MPTLVEPKAKRCSKCNGKGRYRYRNGKYGRCYRCKQSGPQFPQPFRKRTWWGPALFWVLALLCLFLAIQYGAATWMP